ncbi:MAG TPA: glycosyltransferase [Microbacteriaceae bacterium]|jgi:glycosyltransferase involved in cell wall biosynthesis/peptidoglycan/xylan/chitin deacetylase (PgdA/CDA1 family)|nr:glycosyltransferase [Microbacteriaceae bacterium]
MGGTTAARALLRAALPRNCAIVLAFHRVGPSLPVWHTGTTPDHLRAVVELFARVCTPVAAGDLDPNDLQGRLLAVTFDDGFEDNISIAAPVLEEIGVTATFFVSADLVGNGPPWPDEAYNRLLHADPGLVARLAEELAPTRDRLVQLDAAHAVVHGLKALQPSERDAVIARLPPLTEDVGAMMSWDDARSLVSRGFSIGSHGATHTVLPGLPKSTLTYEVEASKRRIENEVGGCDEIAYPDGRFDGTVLEAAAAAGYQSGFIGGQAANGPGFHRLAITRVSGEDPRLLAVAARAAHRSPASFAGQAAGYAASRETEFGFKTQARFVREVTKGVPGEVLDVGCGTGALVPALTGASSITGIDAEPEMIRAANRLYPGHRWLQADASAIPFAADTFDTIVSLGLLEYVDDPDAVVRELARVARPGARIVVSVPQTSSPNAVAYALFGLLRKGGGDPGTPLSRRRLIRALTRAGLSVESVRATNFFTFPFTALAPTASRRVAQALDRLGTLPLLRKLGAQVIAAARKPTTHVLWVAPAVPPTSTFLERELDALRALDADVEAIAPAVSLQRATRTIVRHPFRALATLVELQALKAPRDTERGRRGYVAIWLKGLSLADYANGARLHAVFADGVGTVAYVASRVSGSPYSFAAHSPYSLWQHSPLLAAQARRAQFIACVSENIAEHVRALEPEAHTTIVRCAAPSSDLPKRAPDVAPLFVAVGKLIPHKGFATAIKAATLAARKVPGMRLTVVGDGPEHDHLRKLAADAGEVVVLTGALSNEDVLEQLAGARALLAPCEVQPDGDRDGLPVSILDAAALGVPTIATPVSGIPEFVRPEETGVLVPQFDPEALATAMVELAADQRRADELGAGARKLAAEAHDAKREAAKLIAGWEARPFV